MTQVRIYQKPKNAMQSGRAGTEVWQLDFEPREAQHADPLMGWAGSGDTSRQVGLKFATLEAAKAYAADKGLTYHVIAPPQKVLKLQAYADNFR
jgi:ETC complex I subunit conserved region